MYYLKILKIPSIVSKIGELRVGFYPALPLNFLTCINSSFLLGLSFLILWKEGIVSCVPTWGLSFAESGCWALEDWPAGQGIEAWGERSSGPG